MKNTTPAATKNPMATFVVHRISGTSEGGLICEAGTLIIAIFLIQFCSTIDCFELMMVEERLPENAPLSLRCLERQRENPETHFYSTAKSRAPESDPFHQLAVLELCQPPRPTCGSDLSLSSHTPELRTSPVDRLPQSVH